MTMLDPPPELAPTPGPEPGLEPEPPRRSDDRVVLGVASGLADWLGVDPVWLRLAFVGTSVLGGLGLLLYTAGAVLMPQRGRPLRRFRAVVGAAILVVAALVVVSRFDLPSGPWVLAALLVGVGLALWKPHHPPAARVAPRSAAADTPRLPATDGPAPVAVARERRRAEVRARPPASPLGRIALAAALGLTSVLIAANLAGADIAPAAIAGLATLVLGVGALIGTVRGRARWLLWPGLLAAGIGLVAGAVDGFGLPPVWATSSSTVNASGAVRYESGHDDLYLDLGSLPGDGPVVVRLAAGTVHFWLPQDTKVQLHARVGIGSIEIDGTEVNGYRREVTRVVGPDSGRTVVVDTAVGVGTIRLDKIVHIAPEVPPAPTVPAAVPKAPAAPARPAGVVERWPDGSLVYATGVIVHPDGTADLPDGSVLNADGTLAARSGLRELPDGTRILDDGTAVLADGRIVASDGQVIEREAR